MGSGYKYDRLHSIPLRWMQDKAVTCGLGLKELRTVEANDYRAKMADSFGDFMFGLYKAVKFGKPFERLFGTGMNETVDDSVWQRWNTMEDCRPSSLQDEAKKRGLA